MPVRTQSALAPQASVVSVPEAVPEVVVLEVVVPEVAVLEVAVVAAVVMSSGRTLT